MSRVKSTEGNPERKAEADRWAIDPAAVARARDAVRALTPWDLVGLLFEEFDRRRLDDNGNPRGAPGLYEAATAAVWALIEHPNRAALEEALTTEKDGAARFNDAATQLREFDLAERLAAVGRGVRIRSATQDVAPLIREVSEEIETMRGSTRIRPDAKPGVLAKGLSVRFGRDVAPEAMATALSMPSRSGRAFRAAVAVGLVSESGRHRVISALRE